MSKIEKMEVKEDIKPDENPWEVSSIFDFSFFCCPECDTKSQNKQDFINHTFTYHLWVSVVLDLHFYSLPRENDPIPKMCY